jgi:hypothetical protein
MKTTQCQHPSDYVEHYYDEKSLLGDYYMCSLCNEVTQVG